MSSRLHPAPQRLVVPALVFLLMSVLPARAVIINVDAVNDASGSPVSLFLGAGTWLITPTNPTLDGAAAFTAWSAWSSGPYWLNYLEILDVNAATYHQFGAAGPGVSGSHLTQVDAFAAIAGQQITITLAAPGELRFFVGDNIPGDNRGGMSVDVRAAPVPDSGSPAALVLLGLALIAGARGRLLQRLG